MTFIRLPAAAAAAALAACLATVCATPAFALDPSASPADARAGGDGSDGSVGGQSDADARVPGARGASAAPSGPARPNGPDGQLGPGGMRASGIPGASGMADAPPPPRGPEGFGPHGVGPHGFGGHGPGAPGPDMPFAHFPLHGLQLTDLQQDKVFAIMHAAAPQRREHEKAIRKAHEALRALGLADKLDDARAAALARDLGQAIAAETLLQARTHAQLLAVLTPEQRERLRQRRAGGPEGRGPDNAAAPGGRADRR